VIVAGIDEAGYGPSLGPLVVAAAAFRLAPGAREASLHRLLGLVDTSGAAGAAGLPLDDSKKLWRGTASLATLETSLLGHLALARGLLPLRVAALLDGAPECSAAAIEELPWYAGRLLGTRLPRRADPGVLLARAARHAELLADRGLSVAEILLAPVLEPDFNRLVRQHGSKAWPLFLATGRLLDALMARFPDEPLLVHIDRQGGRTHYAELLTGYFPLAPLRTVRERPAESVYVFDFRERPRVEVRVAVRGDSRRAPVALASIAAKTVRELFMESLNAWFAERAPGLAPTAGYPVDARRFLAQVTGLLPDGPLHGQLVRCR